MKVYTGSSGDAISTHEAKRVEVTLSNGDVVVLREETEGRLTVTSNSGPLVVHPIVTNRVEIEVLR